ncbi:UNVERIFIED_CONTAM: hypothetical protein FKN15_051818 [Acipenser sinensis]
MNGSHTVGSDSNGSNSELWHVESLVVSVILSLSFLIGVPGNLLVIWTIHRHIKHRSHTVVLILNLAVCDFVVLITLPVWIYSLADAWVFGETLCKAMVYVIYSSMYGSVFLITLMSADRFVAIIYPFALQYWKRKDVLFKAIAAVWILAFLFGIPVILSQTADDIDGKLKCLDRVYATKTQEVGCLLLETLVGFAIPFSILSICYLRVGKRIHQITFKTKPKSATLITSVVIAFAVCWFPYHVFNLIRIASTLMEGEQMLAVVAETGVYICGALVFISSCINPLLYAFAARRFQGCMKESRITKLFQEITTSTTRAKETNQTCLTPRMKRSAVSTVTV